MCLLSVIILKSNGESSTSYLKTVVHHLAVPWITATLFKMCSATHPIYFFDSNTTLELLPGVYNITENVGQLVLINVENFILRGSSPNVTITCQSGATWGLTIIKGQVVGISNIQSVTVLQSYCLSKVVIQFHQITTCTLESI